MKQFTFVILFLFFPLFAMASGSSVRGGGDMCENRIKSVRDDIKEWILKGGSEALSLPAGLSRGEYKKGMLQHISMALVSCVGKGDQDYPVEVDGVAKVCRFEKWQRGERITCDSDKFRALNESDQYVLIHHEYAGLAEIESPIGSNSVYPLSNQISGFLVEQVVKKLAVRPRSSRLTTVTLNDGDIRSVEISLINVECKKYHPRAWKEENNDSVCVGDSVPGSENEKRCYLEPTITWTLKINDKYTLTKEAALEFTVGGYPNEFFSGAFRVLRGKKYSEYLNTCLQNGEDRLYVPFSFMFLNVLDMINSGIPIFDKVSSTCAKKGLVLLYETTTFNVKEYKYRDTLVPCK